MYRIVLCISVILTIVCCYAQENSIEKNHNEPSATVETDSITAIIEGKFVGLNTDGDFSLLLLENSNGDIVSFIFTADSILVNEPQYEGKTLRVTYKIETFEEAGSGEKFEGNYIISVQVTD